MDSISNMIGTSGTVADIMSGTGSVALELKKRGYKVIASDIMTYSYHHLVTNLQVATYPLFNGLYKEHIISQESACPYSDVLQFLNNLAPRPSFFFREFSSEGIPQNGCPPRKYFTSDNAAKIDAIRETINEWISFDLITTTEESLLKHTLIMAANEVANISGTYGYFLSEFKKNARERLVLSPTEIFPHNSDGHSVYLGFAEDLAKSITADLCYIDPPYMKRQYAANYHILETLARGDYPDAIGKSGLRDWWDQHSKLCTKTQGLQSFEQILSDMHCNRFLISYSEDGLFPLEQLKECFSKYGTVKIQFIDYNRFRSNDSKLPPKLKEYLISIER